MEPLAAPIAETRTRYGRTVRAPVRYEPVEKVEDDYNTDDYDEGESEVSSVIEYSDSELDDDDSDLDDFIVPDRDESDESDNGTGTDTDADSTTSGVQPPVARGGAATPRKIPTKVPVRGKK
jgi:hypothetical protein